MKYITYPTAQAANELASALWVAYYGGEVQSRGKAHGSSLDSKGWVTHSYVDVLVHPDGSAVVEFNPRAQAFLATLNGQQFMVADQAELDAVEVGELNPKLSKVKRGRAALGLDGMKADKVSVTINAAAAREEAQLSVKWQTFLEARRAND